MCVGMYLVTNLKAKYAVVYNAIVSIRKCFLGTYLSINSHFST